MIPLYTLFVGASASVVRAALMGALTVIARMLGRSNDALNALSLSAFLMTLWDPAALEDIAFQLSFAATWGLLFLAPPLERWMRAALARWFQDPGAATLADAVREALLVSLAAQIATAPLILYHFRELSLVAPLANLLALYASNERLHHVQSGEAMAFREGSELFAFIERFVAALSPPGEGV